MTWHRITVNLPPEYKEPVKARAADQNRNVTGYIKNLIDADLKKAGVKVPSPKVIKSV